MTAVDSTFSMLPAYAELFAFSNFTFLHGASRGEELVVRAAQLGYPGLAITDECSLAGVVRAHVQAKEAKLPLVIGSYFKLVNADGSPAFGLILLAQNREGYGNLSELITLAPHARAQGRVPADAAGHLSRPEKEYRASARHAGLPRDSRARFSGEGRRARRADRMARRHVSRPRVGWT